MALHQVNPVDFRSRTAVWILGGLIAILPSLAMASPLKSVTICADPDPPPGVYWKRDAQGRKSSEITGAAVDLLSAAFSRMGITVEMQGQYPWSRCMLMVERGQIDFAMGAYFDDDRAQRFDYSAPYQTLSPRVFFRQDSPVIIQKLSDLKQYKGCGMNGASYSHYGLRNEDLDLGNGYESLISKLLAKRCDYFVEELEIITSYRLLGKDYLANTALKYGPVPGAKAPAKHLITGKGSPASALIPALNQELKKLVRSGSAARIWKVHAGDLPYQP